ncbi:MAG: hypothetical protein LBQ95_02030 [Lachnospiraceae bacterium]|jgi:bacteriocin-like protein|nr:hypothetical protein [Lachnospiraceae bacterium]
MKKLFLGIPQNAEELDEKEMRKINGGTSIRVAKSMTSKNNCYNMAAQYQTRDLTQRRIAIEIYAHAFLYYASTALITAINSNICNAMGGKNILPELQWIANHSNPIDIGGDSKFRVSVFEWIWNNVTGAA